MDPYTDNIEELIVLPTATIKLNKIQKKHEVLLSGGGFRISVDSHPFDVDNLTESIVVNCEDGVANSLTENLEVCLLPVLHRHYVEIIFRFPQTVRQDIHLRLLHDEIIEDLGMVSQRLVGIKQKITHRYNPDYRHLLVIDANASGDDYGLGDFNVRKDGAVEVISFGVGLYNAQGTYRHKDHSILLNCNQVGQRSVANVFYILEGTPDSIQTTIIHDDGNDKDFYKDGNG